MSGPGEPLRRGAHLVGRSVRAAFAVVSGAGWAMLAVGLAAWFLAGPSHLAELRLVGGFCLALFAVCVVMVAGRTWLEVRVTLDPVRLTAGAAADGEVRATARHRSWLPSPSVEVPVDGVPAIYNLPRLPRGGVRRFWFRVPTVRRGVVQVGPPRLVFGDPFGLLRRESLLGEALELFVHPKVLHLPSLDAGRIRDLEGRPTTDLSAADLDFHTLREYVPGDDLRHIHWKSTARASSAGGVTTLLTKRYLDTRRSHVTIVLDADTAAYPDPEVFETAVTAAASVAVRGVKDQIDLSVVAGSQVMDRLPGHLMLDGFARVELDTVGLSTRATRAAAIAPGTSIAVVVSGPGRPFTQVRRAAAQFPPEVTCIGLRIVPGESSGRVHTMGMTVFTLGALEDLPRLVEAWGATR